MAHTKSFVISEFTNPSGEIVYRVSGWLDGKRIRKNFPTRAEAKAEADALEIQLVQDETGVRPTVTRLTEEQLHECEAIVQRLAGKPHPLSFYVDFALANYREPAARKLLSEAVTEYEHSKDHEREQDLLSEPHLVRVKRDLKRLKKRFPAANVADLTAARLLEYFEAGRAGLKTFNNRRGIVSTFLKFALQRGWIGENPLIKIPQRRIRRRRSNAVTFSADQAEQLMTYVEKHHAEAVPYFALCLFAGIRPCLRTGEIFRLDQADIKLDLGRIRISAEVSKIREPRNVVIQSNLAAWLRAYPLKKFPIIPANLQHIREKVAQKFPLSHDVMRHTFISMFVAKFRSLGEAALQAGNSEGIIRKHYLDLKTFEEAEHFFGVLPKLQTAELRDSAPFDAAKGISVDLERVA